MSSSVPNKPHAICIPLPAQGHINPMLKLAKLLHYRGFHITFVNTEYNHKRLLKSRGPNSLDGMPDFQFKKIPDGLPPVEGDDLDSTQDVPSLCDSTSKNCLAPFRQLLAHINSSAEAPRVTCIVTDGVMSFSLEAAEELGIPCVLFWTTSACGFLGYMHYHHLVDRGIVPLKDARYLTNGHLDTIIDWIPGLKDIRLRDFPSFVRTTDPNDIMLNFAIGEASRAPKASAVIINTFDDLEHESLSDLSSMIPRVLSIGPLQLLLDQITPQQKQTLSSIGSNLWREEPECLEWLNNHAQKSVVYVNFGSVTVMTPQQLVEFAWGLADSKQNFLWIIRSDLVRGEKAILPPEFLDETKERGFMAGWCPQEHVLNHPSTGGFLTHSGWNSTIESVCGGVPMVCWPFFAEQQTNCWACVNSWGIGVEIDNDVKRDKVRKLVTELMEGKQGKEMRKKAGEWKAKAEKACGPNGSSSLNFDKLVKKVLPQE